MSKGAKLFAYGTLQDPTIQHWIWGRAIEGQGAVLDRYSMYHFQSGIRYIIPDPEGHVQGRLYSGLTEADLKHSDAYETEAYERVQVMVNRGERFYTAWTYVASLDNSGDPE